jgi:hypothetical protein
MRLQTFVIAVILVFSFLVRAETLSAAVEVGGTITSDTTWTSIDTIIVTDSIIVADSVLLTIQAGTIIMFSPGTALSVEGELMANGEKNNRNLFTSSADTAGGSPVAGEWYGVSFQENSTGILYHCDLRYADSCVDIYGSSPEFYGCVIEDFSSGGFYIDGYSASPPITTVIEGCVIRQNDAGLVGTGTGIFVYRSVDITVSGCKISNCYYGIDFAGRQTLAPHFQVSNCDIRDHASRGIYAHAGG